MFDICNDTIEICILSCIQVLTSGVDVHIYINIFPPTLSFCSMSKCRPAHKANNSTIVEVECEKEMIKVQRPAANWLSSTVA